MLVTHVWRHASSQLPGHACARLFGISMPLAGAVVCIILPMTRLGLLYSQIVLNFQGHSLCLQVPRPALGFTACLACRKLVCVNA